MDRRGYILTSLAAALTEPLAAAAQKSGQSACMMAVFLSGSCPGGC
jgi:hypothetical protein